MDLVEFSDREYESQELCDSRQFNSKGSKQAVHASTVCAYFIWKTAVCNQEEKKTMKEEQVKGIPVNPALQQANSTIQMGPRPFDDRYQGDRGLKSRRFPRRGNKNALQRVAEVNDMFMDTLPVPYRFTFKRRENGANLLVSATTNVPLVVSRVAGERNSGHLNELVRDSVTTLRNPTAPNLPLNVDTRVNLNIDTARTDISENDPPTGRVSKRRRRRPSMYNHYKKSSTSIALAVTPTLPRDDDSDVHLFNSRLYDGSRPWNPKFYANLEEGFTFHKSDVKPPNQPKRENTKKRLQTKSTDISDGNNQAKKVHTDTNLTVSKATNATQPAKLVSKKSGDRPERPPAPSLNEQERKTPLQTTENVLPETCSAESPRRHPSARNNSSPESTKSEKKPTILPSVGPITNVVGNGEAVDASRAPSVSSSRRENSSKLVMSTTPSRSTADEHWQLPHLTVAEIYDQLDPVLRGAQSSEANSESAKDKWYASHGTSSRVVPGKQPSLKDMATTFKQRSMKVLENSERSVDKLISERFKNNIQVVANNYDNFARVRRLDSTTSRKTAPQFSAESGRPAVGLRSSTEILKARNIPVERGKLQRESILKRENSLMDQITREETLLSTVKNDMKSQMERGIDEKQLVHDLIRVNNKTPDDSDLESFANAFALSRSMTDLSSEIKSYQRRRSYSVSEQPKKTPRLTPRKDSRISRADSVTSVAQSERALSVESNLRATASVMHARKESSTQPVQKLVPPATALKE